MKKKKPLKIAVANWNGVASDLINKLRERGHHVIDGPIDKGELKKQDVLITWNEVHKYGNEVFLQSVKDAGVKTILLQHGRKGTSRIYPPFNESLICDIACVWGKFDKERLIECGNPADRIIVTGTPIFKTLKPRVPHKGINVVFSPEHWSHEVPENAIVASALRKVKGINVITKALRGEHSLNSYDGVVVSDRNTPEHFSIVADVLSKADVVVAISESTFELLAQSLDIPVVIADIWIPKANDGDDRYKEYKRIYSDACTRVKDVYKIGDAIHYAIKHPEHLRKERKQICIDEGGIDINNPTERVIEIIEQ